MYKRQRHEHGLRFGCGVLASGFGFKSRCAQTALRHVPQAARLDLSCLRQHADKGRYSHDNFYHSMLGLLDVQSRVYQPGLDLFAACRGLGARGR